MFPPFCGYGRLFSSQQLKFQRLDSSVAFPSLFIDVIFSKQQCQNILRIVFFFMIKMELCTFLKSGVTYVGKECVSDWWEQGQKKICSSWQNPSNNLVLVDTMDLYKYWQTVWTIQPSSLVQHGHGGQGFCPGQFNVLYLPQNDSLPTDRCRILQPRSPAKQTETQPSAPTPVVSLTHKVRRVWTVFGAHYSRVLCVPVQNISTGVSLSACCDDDSSSFTL